ncbi:hypothetical protein ACTPD5_22555 [Clostridioides difficile]
MPTENTEISLYSLSHGAGRKWSRFKSSYYCQYG